MPKEDRRGEAGGKGNYELMHLHGGNTHAVIFTRGQPAPDWSRPALQAGPYTQVLDTYHLPCAHNPTIYSQVTTVILIPLTFAFQNRV